MTDIDYLPAQLAGLATSLRMMGRDNSADIAQRGGTGVNFYNPFVQCWSCGDGESRLKEAET